MLSVVFTVTPVLGTSIPISSGKTGPEGLNDIARVVQLVCNKASIRTKNFHFYLSLEIYFAF